MSTAEWRRKEASEGTVRHARVGAKGSPTPSEKTDSSVANPRQAPNPYRKEDHQPQLMLAARGGRGCD